MCVTLPNLHVCFERTFFSLHALKVLNSLVLQNCVLFHHIIIFTVINLYFTSCNDRTPPPTHTMRNVIVVNTDTSHEQSPLTAMAPSV